MPNFRITKNGIMRTIQKLVWGIICVGIYLFIVAGTAFAGLEGTYTHDKFMAMFIASNLVWIILAGIIFGVLGIIKFLGKDYR